MTPEERARDRYPKPTAFFPTADGWKTINHRADGYAACIRELVDPLEARIKELQAVLSNILTDIGQPSPDGWYGLTLHDDEVTSAFEVLNKTQ